MKYADLHTALPQHNSRTTAKADYLKLPEVSFSLLKKRFGIEH